MFSSRLTVLLGALASVVSALPPQTCSNTGLSCQVQAPANTCCFNHPGGQLLLTQFWDYDPAFGPKDSWTIHGVWPDNCDGSYESFCDSSRAYTGAESILKNAGEEDLLDELRTYWKDNGGDDASFWEYEWEKHGTCISTLETTCYDSYSKHEEFIDYLHLAIDLHKSRDTYKILADAGITPSSTKKYATSAIQAALDKAHGGKVTLRCRSGAVNELWYSYNVRGSVQTGEWVGVDATGTQATCSGDVYYYPKEGSREIPDNSTVA